MGRHGRFPQARLVGGRITYRGSGHVKKEQPTWLIGRRLTWDGIAATPTGFTVSEGASQVQTTEVSVGIPLESQPNDTPTNANPLSVNSYVEGRIVASDVQDDYRVQIPTASTYRFETSDVFGACEWGLELDTKMDLLASSGTTVTSNDDSGALLGPQCSKLAQKQIAKYNRRLEIERERGRPQCSAADRDRVEVGAPPVRRTPVPLRNRAGIELIEDFKATTQSVGCDPQSMHPNSGRPDLRRDLGRAEREHGGGDVRWRE